MAILSAYPIFKQVGGKGQLLSDLLHVCPESPRRYVEPFVGGAALFFGLARLGRLAESHVVLCDSSIDLIRTFQNVRDEPEGVIASLRQFEEQYHAGNREEFYYRIREAWNRGRRSAARFIFLRQTAFNGLWRFNRNGQLNMAFGHYAKPKILDEAGIRAASAALHRVDLVCADWVETLSKRDWWPGDLVYCDPPYMGCFNQYDADGFAQEEHEALIAWCGTIARAGAHVVYSNEDGPPVRALLEQHWPEARIITRGSRRYVNRDGKGRQPIPDLIASSHGSVQGELPL
jgi:DNA adenine methylase